MSLPVRYVMGAPHTHSLFIGIQRLWQVAKGQPDESKLPSLERMTPSSRMLYEEALRRLDILAKRHETLPLKPWSFTRYFTEGRKRERTQLLRQARWRVRRLAAANDERSLLFFLQDAKAAIELSQEPAEVDDDQAQQLVAELLHIPFADVTRADTMVVGQWKHAFHVPEAMVPGHIIRVYRQPVPTILKRLAGLSEGAMSDRTSDMQMARVRDIPGKAMDVIERVIPRSDFDYRLMPPYRSMFPVIWRWFSKPVPPSAVEEVAAYIEILAKRNPFKADYHFNEGLALRETANGRRFVRLVPFDLHDSHTEASVPEPSVADLTLEEVADVIPEVLQLNPRFDATLGGRVNLEPAPWDGPYRPWAGPTRRHGQGDAPSAFALVSRAFNLLLDPVTSFSSPIRSLGEMFPQRTGLRLSFLRAA